MQKNIEKIEERHEKLEDLEVGLSFEIYIHLRNAECASKLPQELKGV